MVSANAVGLQMPVRSAPFSVTARARDGVADSSTATPAVAEPVVSDEALFGSAAKGDRDALGRLIARFEQPLYGLLVRMTNGDTHRAEDLFQDTFLHAMRAAATFNPKMSFKPWVTAIAVNLVRDDARKRKVRGEVALEGGNAEDARLPEPADNGENPIERAERKDEESTVHRAIGRLTAVEREVVLLHFFNGMTLVESAESLGIPLGTVKSRLHAALTRLGKLLGRSS